MIMIALGVLLSFLLLAAVVAAWTTYKQIQAYQAEFAQRNQALTRNLVREQELDPRYQAKLAADRRYTLAMRELDLKQYLATSRLDVAQYGTVLINQEETRFTHLQPVYKPVAAKEEAKQIVAPTIARPTQEAIIAQLPYNEYMVSPGVNATTGEIVVVNLLDVPHIKFIGAPGFGKSCLAASILDQVSQTNDRTHLQLALLDCEHKTSKLFEHNPNIAQVRVGGRVVDLVATDADMVAVQLGFLKREMLRRAELDEAELDRQPVMLMYVEEMLSLQYEVDPRLLQQMIDDILILAVRARKYRMFLLSCMQTDYSTQEMKVSQKMYRLRGAAAIDPTAARAAGFQNTELVKANFAQGQKGQFVIEYPGFSGMVLVPGYDVKKKLQQLHPDVSGTFTSASGERIQSKIEDNPDAGIVEADRPENESSEALPANVRTFPQSGMNAPVDERDATSGERPKDYRLTDEEIPRFVAAYKASGNVDKALAAIDHGARFRKHAGELVAALGLRKDA
jgi:hypothetical protein